MAVQASSRVVHIGKTDQLSGFAIPTAEFNAIAIKLWHTTPNFGKGEFPLSYSFFSGEYDQVVFDNINAFLFLEELESLIKIDHGFTEREQDQFMLIYNNAKYQAYQTTKVTLQEVPA